MIKPKCSRCGEELQEPGAILLSPPEKFLDMIPETLKNIIVSSLFNDVRCKTDHLCKKCYKFALEVLKISS